MATGEERLAIIEASVLGQAQAECDEWRKKAEDYRRQEMENFERELLVEMYSKIRAEVDRKTRAASEAVSRSAREQREKLLRRREQIRGAVFSEVRAELIAWTETEAYRDSFLAGVRELADACDHAASTLLARECDMPLAERCREILGEGLTLRADASILIGGFALENSAAGVRIDQTLDTRLRDANTWFLEHSGLSIV